jgi:hypothetical protein
VLPPWPEAKEVAVAMQGEAGEGWEGQEWVGQELEGQGWEEQGWEAQKQAEEQRFQDMFTKELYYNLPRSFPQQPHQLL